MSPLHDVLGLEAQAATENLRFRVRTVVAQVALRRVEQHPLIVVRALHRLNRLRTGYYHAARIVPPTTTSTGNQDSRPDYEVLAHCERTVRIGHLVAPKPGG